MRDREHIYNLKWLSRNSNFILCGDCRQILGYIDREALCHIFLHMSCKCGNGGYIEIGRANGNETEIETAVRLDSGVYCGRCKSRWFMPSNHILGFAFKAECNCGMVSNTCHKPKRVLSAGNYKLKHKRNG